MLTSWCGDAPLTPVCTPTSRYALAMLCGRPKGEAAALNMTMGLCWLCVLVLNIGTNTGELECLERPVVRCLFPLKLAKFIQRRGAEAQRRRGAEAQRAQRSAEEPEFLCENSAPSAPVR